jgi:hypothetical protein
MWALVLLLLGCKNDSERRCFGTPGDVSSCGEVCRRGNEKGCVTQTEVATERCMKGHDVETCRWMCLYGHDGKDLYCAEHLKITGKPVE